MTSREESSDKIELDLGRMLYRIGAIKFGSFKLTSGRLSPYYIDLRIISSFPEIFHKVNDALVDFIKRELKVSEINRVGGVPTAGIPFATVAAYLLRKPFLYIRTSKKRHGRGRRVEGAILPGDNVLLIDDLVTTGSSLIKAAKAVISEGGVVSDAVVLIDREEGGNERLSKIGVKLHALFKIMDIAKTLHDIDAIDNEQLDMIQKQIKRKK